MFSHVRYLLYYVKDDTVSLYSFVDCKYLIPHCYLRVFLYLYRTRIFIYLYMTGSISTGCYRPCIFGLSEINKYNRAPDHIKILDKILSFKGELRSCLLQYAFYSGEEYMS
jgi:hypothetical protein